MEEHITTTKKILYEWADKYMDTHTDWTGKRVETINECDSIDDFVDNLFEYIKENESRRY